jgi:hypothetical protein
MFGHHSGVDEGRDTDAERVTDIIGDAMDACQL